MCINIVDCTIRDGGHLCKWNFDIMMVKESYSAAIKGGADYFEVGYRNFREKKELGEFAFCEDEFLFKLLKPSSKCKITVMIDAGKADATLFKECKEELTPIKAVRVAAYPYEYKKAIEIIEELFYKGYEVFLNLMAFSEISSEQYHFLEEWNGKNQIKAINFADSFGGLFPNDIRNYYQKLKTIGFDNVGFHSHNNLQLAFANCLEAMEVGCKYIDASVYGMGRGAGNLPIEILISYFQKKGKKKYNVVPYLDVIDRYYIKVFETLKWGYSLNSLMSGVKNIHPYYVDEVMKKNVYTVDEAWNALDTIKEKCSISFSKDKLDHVLDRRFYKPLTSEKVAVIYDSLKEQLKIIPAKDAFEVEDCEFKDIHNERNFVVIANGPSIKEYKDRIDKFCVEKEAVTIGVNYIGELFVPDYHMFISRKRFLKYNKNINEKSTLLVPSFWGRELISSVYSNKYKFFNLRCTDNYNEKCIIANSQICVNLNVAISAILMAYEMGASKIYVVGMDGYIDELNKKITYFYDEEDNIEGHETSAVIYDKLCKELERMEKFLMKNGIQFNIITPTSYRKYYRNVFSRNRG